MEIPGGRLSAHAGEPSNAGAWPIYHSKAEIIRNIRLKFDGLLLTSIFQKIDWKFHFEDLADKLFVEWKIQKKMYILKNLSSKMIYWSWFYDKWFASLSG